MSEQNFDLDDWSAEETYPGSHRSVRMGAVPSQDAYQLGLNFDPPPPSSSAVERIVRPSTPPPLAEASPHNPQEPDPLLTELLQMRSLMQGQIERIRHLEQALDQSLASLNELRSQVVDQQFLETQLASTEEISNIQQQAITQLKQQLAHYEVSLETQTLESHQREQVTQELLEKMESLTQTQHTELERLRNQIAHDRSAARTYQNTLERRLADLQATFDTQQQKIVDLETQSLSARVQAANLETQLAQAQAQVQQFSQALNERQVALEQLETELRQAHIVLQEQQETIAQLQQNRTIPRLSPPSQRVPDLNVAQTRIEELEAQLARQLTTQAMLQHACQELELERDQQQLRITNLENQTTDMQEQILKQAQQASEYETAIQHWKDRYLSHRDQAMQAKEQIEHLFPNPSPEIIELLNLLQAGGGDMPEPASPALFSSPALNPHTKVDLPDFLMRRRSYKNRRSS